MKNLYVCEKCGKMFEDYDLAWACERSHATVDQIYSWDLPSDENMQTEFYAQGESTPEYIVFKATELDKDGFNKMRTMPNGSEMPKYKAVVYKRIDKVKLPNGYCPTDYTDAMLRRQITDHSAVAENEEEDEG